VGAFKNVGRHYDKTIQPPCGRKENKQTSLRSWKCTPSAAFGGVSPGGGDLFSVQLLFS
jgi:hypothetical protein